MNPQTITRNALDLYLRVALAPASKVARFTRFGKDEMAPLELAVDRFDATVRQFAGRALGDDELLADAARRRAAAENRETAIELRAKAEQKEQEAERKRQEREAQAERVRENGQSQAEQKRQEAEERERQRKQSVRKSAQTRKQAVKQSAARKKQAIAEKERAARLVELEQKEEALDAEEKALTEAERAARLKQSADKTKSRTRS